MCPPVGVVLSCMPRLKVFFGMFDFVESKIDQVYKELTRSDRFPMGGCASISLPSRDDPFSGMTHHLPAPLLGSSANGLGLWWPVRPLWVLWVRLGVWQLVCTGWVRMPAAALLDPCR